MARAPIVLAALALSVIASVTALLLLATSDESDVPDTDPPLAQQQPDATATPTPEQAPAQSPHIQIHIDAPDALADRIYAEAQALTGEMGVLLISSDSPEGAGVTVSRPAGDSPAEMAVVERWVAVTSMWSLLDRVVLSAALGFPLLLPVESRDVLEPMLVDTAQVPSARWLPEADIPSALASDETAVALLPIESAPGYGGLRSLTIAADGGRWLGFEDVPWLEQRLVIRWTRDDLQDFASRLAERIEVPAPPLTTIVFTGDIIPARCVYERQRNLDDYTAAFEHVEAYLSGADITVGSVDATISDAGEPYACEETFNLMAPSRSVEGLVAAGFDMITVATNHARDCGKPDFGCGNDALLDTLANLRGHGIEPVGGGENLTEARAPAILERDGVRFAFLGYDDIASSFLGATDSLPGTAPLSEEALREDIAAAIEIADVVIVLPQWGIEYTPTPSDRQLRLGRAAIEAGATLVAGNHPHIVQGVEAGPGTFIAYALGNFVFDQDWSLETQQGAVLEANFLGDRLLSVTLRPIRIMNMFQPTFADEAEARTILDRMRESSEALTGR